MNIDIILPLIKKKLEKNIVKINKTNLTSYPLYCPFLYSLWELNKKLKKNNKIKNKNKNWIKTKWNKWMNTKITIFLGVMTGSAICACLKRWPSWGQRETLSHYPWYTSTELTPPFSLDSLLEHAYLLRPLVEQHVVSPAHCSISWAYRLNTDPYGRPSNLQFAKMTLKPLILLTNLPKMIHENPLKPSLRAHLFLLVQENIFIIK